MKSRTSHPALISPSSRVPLTITVKPEDAQGLSSTDGGAELMIAAGIVAHRAAHKNGYRVVEVRSVEPTGDVVTVEAWATGS